MELPFWNPTDEVEIEWLHGDYTVPMEMKTLQSK